MQFTGTLQFQGVAGEPEGAPVALARFESEMARVQGLSDQAIEALCTIIDARDAFDVVRKLHRFVAALVSPAAVLARAFAGVPGDFTRFCIRLAAFRVYLERLERGATPRDAASSAERARDEWLGREPGAPAGTRDTDVPGAGVARETDDFEDEDIPDMFDAEGEIDPGAVRAEIDRLLRRLQVAPERVDITILPDELAPPDRPRR